MNQDNPPTWALRFFRWYCHPRLVDHIEGDLHEVYLKRLRTKGKRKATTRFIIDVLLLFRPGIIRSAEGYKNLNQYGMIKSYFKIGWRSLLKDRMFSFINLSGLSLGLICSLLIYLWIQDEYKIDAFHENIDRLFIVTSCEYSGDERNGSYDTPGLLGEELKKVFPEVALACNYSWTSYHHFEAGEKKVLMPGTFAGRDFFHLFSYPLILGTKNDALTAPESIAISRKMAVALFGSPEAALHELVRFENNKDLKVTAVFEDRSNQMSENYQYIINWHFFTEQNDWIKDWHNSGPTTVLLVNEQADAQALSVKMRSFIKKYDEDYSDLDRLELGLQPFGEKYLHSNFRNGQLSGGRIEYVRLFTWVAIFILLIAAINFMNLSTARSLKRAKEIGVRKVNGAMKTAIISQFLMEAFLFTVLAIAMSLVLLTLVLPQFNLVTEKNIQLPFSDPSFWMKILALTIFTTLLSGTYPAFLLSSFKPITIFRHSLKTGSSSVLRKGLVVFQFALSMIFIVSVIVITRQVRFIQHKNIGYQKENFMYLPITGTLAKHYDAFRNDALKIPGVSSVSSMSTRPMEIDASTGGVEWENKPANSKPTFIQAAVGYDFIKTMKSTLVYGRDFSEDYADSANYIINETALKTIGYKNPIGMPLTFWGVKGTIIGVVKDFHFNSLHVPIRPLVLRLKSKNTYGVALIRVEPGKTSPALTGLEALHQKLNPDFIFAIQFADEEYSYLHRSEQIVKQLSVYFAFLAILISSLGLLGLVVFRAEQRTKEIGIRKVLGASVANLVALLSKDFMRLIALSILLSCPIAFYIMKEWLAGFEYHINIEWWMFVIAGTVSLVIALLTISVQALQAAVSNPVKSLRSE